MSDLKAAQDMMASAVAAKSTVDPELVSVTQLLKSLGPQLQLVLQRGGCGGDG